MSIKTIAIVDGSGKVISRHELTPRNTVYRDGKPVFGPRHRLPLTIKEIMAAGLAPSRNKASDMRRDGHPDSVTMLKAA